MRLVVGHTNEGRNGIFNIKLKMMNGPLSIDAKWIEEEWRNN